jgi:hypothetical protein
MNVQWLVSHSVVFGKVPFAVDERTAGDDIVGAVGSSRELLPYPGRPRPGCTAISISDSDAT